MDLEKPPPLFLAVLGLLVGLALGLWISVAVVQASPVGAWGTYKAACEKGLPRTQQCVIQWVPAQAQPQKDSNQ